MTITPVRHAITLFAAVLAASFAGFTGQVAAQDYPGKPIRLISPYQPGGSTDLALNLFRERLTAKWGQPVIVEYRPGAAGTIGSEMVFRSPADGYTLLLAPTATVTATKYLYTKIRYDPAQFTAITLISEMPNILVVHPGVPAQNLQQLIDYARANPEKMNHAVAGEGGPAHLAAETLQIMTGTKITKVPYNAGAGPAMTALIGGHVQMAFQLMSIALPHVRAGTIRALAVGSEKRSPLLPDVPTMSETLPGFISMNSSGVVGPPDMPPVVVAKISAALAEILRDPAVAKRFLDTSATAIGNTPAEHAAYLKRESDMAGKTIRAIGLTLD